MKPRLCVGLIKISFMQTRGGMLATKAMVRPRSSGCNILACSSSLGTTGRSFRIGVAAEVQKATGQILAKHGRIDLQVNSAGVNVPKRRWADMELEGWKQLVDINLNGVLYCMHAVLPAMRRQKNGCIINVSSWAGRHVSKMPGPAYTTTKHAVLALTHSFNMDECVNGLRACCLMPGEVATPILTQRPVVPSKEEQAKMLQPEDLGRTIAFVASMPPRVCMNEILISPTHNRGFIQTPANRD